MEEHSPPSPPPTGTCSLPAPLLLGPTDDRHPAQEAEDSPGGGCWGDKSPEASCWSQARGECLRGVGPPADPQIEGSQTPKFKSLVMCAGLKG